MTNILDKIISQKKEEVEQSKKVLPLERLKAAVKVGNPPRHGKISDALKKHFCVIAEVKKGSPSKGIIRHDFDPVAIAKQYLKAGADAISVLTDEKFFFGRLEYLTKISRFSTVPLLRKDFIIDEYQVWEARAAGADFILLIASVLTSDKIRKFTKTATDLGMEVLTEVHDMKDLAKALKAGAKIVGVNNRDLKTFKTDIGHSIKLKKHIPRSILTVSESGINSAEDAILLRDAGFNAVLVGESLMRQNEPGKLLKQLRITPQKRKSK